ncbi:hypothetical protein [Archangium lansingense]|uniref:Uncharacterized protein n=1 Tax=Archangium lansingense TaxID=2995310 RepID=A0ABT3ZWP3_9BACT|nr:hypothetical protein [Archangium lansinium]MCY1073810.1 hypothetical protein [Archangium lansinium]
MSGADITASHLSITEGDEVVLIASPNPNSEIRKRQCDAQLKERVYTFHVDGGIIDPRKPLVSMATHASARWTARGVGAGRHKVSVVIRETYVRPTTGQEETFDLDGEVELTVQARPGATTVAKSAEAPVEVPVEVPEVPPVDEIPEEEEPETPPVGGPAGGQRPAGRAVRESLVTLQRTSRRSTEDEILWMVIRRSTQDLSFENYERFLDRILCGEGTGALLPPVPCQRGGTSPIRRMSSIRLPFPGVDAYRLLKAATETFLMCFGGVQIDFSTLDIQEEERRLEHPIVPPGVPDPADTSRVFERLFKKYLVQVNGAQALPYLALVRERLKDVPLSRPPSAKDMDETIDCIGILREKLTNPLLVELIWSYWHEEGMLAQALNVISLRFQNRRRGRERDPLAQLELDPLRPLNSLLWGYIQDEQHRLSVVRRAYEYDHHYGFSLHGKAVGELHSADRRSKFLESFHNLLHEAIRFFRQDDDTTVIADGFPLLNAIKETHYMLAQGAHNQYSDMPSTARQEMLMQQWLLSRPEMREFLGTRVMVPYPEPWMDRVDSLKTLLGWTDVSMVHFHDLAVFGERLLLSIRFGGWSVVNDPSQAANWARYWRPEVQGYVHGYRAVTGVDLSVELTDRQRTAERYLPPSVHLQNRLEAQRRR